MKKNILFFAILIIAVAVTLVYWSKKSNSENAIPLDNTASVTKSIDRDAAYFTGDIQIATNISGDITVIINGKDVKNSRLFIIQGGNYNIQESIQKGEIVYLLHSIIINSLEKKERYYFAVSKPEEKLIYSELPATWKSFFTKTANGYGVVKMQGSIPTEISQFKRESDTYADLKNFRQSLITTQNGGKVVTDLGNPGGGIGTTSCDDGGEGATTCGVGSANGTCNVSCTTGYYACCNYAAFGAPTCKCIKIKTN